MKKFLINYSYAIYLGFIMSFLLDTQWYKWEFYIITIPTALLVEWKVNNKHNQ